MWNHFRNSFVLFPPVIFAQRCHCIFFYFDISFFSLTYWCSKAVIFIALTEMLLSFRSGISICLQVSVTSLDNPVHFFSYWASKIFRQSDRRTKRPIEAPSRSFKINSFYHNRVFLLYCCYLFLFHSQNRTILTKLNSWKEKLLPWQRMVIVTIPQYPPTKHPFPSSP